jgi:hypothetical protein
VLLMVLALATAPPIAAIATPVAVELLVVRATAVLTALFAVVVVPVVPMFAGRPLFLLAEFARGPLFLLLSRLRWGFG